MKNPCINCPDRKESISACEGPHCWEKREAYLRHIQNDGTYFDGVKSVAANDVPKQEIMPSKNNGGKAMSESNNNTKNKLLDLNNHLFEQLRRLNSDKLNGEKLTEEIARAKAVSGIASQIINNAKVSLDAMIAINEARIKSTPGMIGMSYEDEKE